MKLNELSPATGSVREAYRKGRGAGSGNGKTAGRGHKGQATSPPFSLSENFSVSSDACFVSFPYLSIDSAHPSEDFFASSR